MSSKTGLTDQQISDYVEDKMGFDGDAEQQDPTEGPDLPSFWSLFDDPQEFIAFAASRGVATGSYFFGCSEFKDKDYVLGVTAFHAFLEAKSIPYLDSFYERQNSYETKKLEEGGFDWSFSLRWGNINIIIKSDADIPIWEKATDLMIRIRKASHLICVMSNEKAFRIDLFIALRALAQRDEKRREEHENE